MRVDERQPWTSTPVTQKPWLDILRPQVPFEKDVVLEEDHRGGDVVRHPPELLDWILLSIGEGSGDVEVDLKVEYRIRKLRLPRGRVWTVENFRWHVDIGVVGRQENVKYIYIGEHHEPRARASGAGINGALVEWNHYVVTVHIIGEHLHVLRSPDRGERS